MMEDQYLREGERKKTMGSGWRNKTEVRAEEAYMIQLPLYDSFNLPPPLALQLMRGVGQ